jgi:hypothetical protein
MTRVSPRAISPRRRSNPLDVHGLAEAVAQGLLHQGVVVQDLASAGDVLDAGEHRGQKVVGQDALELGPDLARWRRSSGNTRRRTGVPYSLRPTTPRDAGHRGTALRWSSVAIWRPVITAAQKWPVAIPAATASALRDTGEGALARGPPRRAPAGDPLPCPCPMRSTRSPREIQRASCFKRPRRPQRFSRDPKWLGGEIGITMMLHTWGQNLSQHLHVHCVLSGGALTPHGRWIPAKRGFLFPVRALSVVFRRK